jgi:uncharacterized protein YndB with AHSA1/START domain
MTDFGDITPDGDRRTIRFERRYDASPDDVWSALTDSGRLERWLAPGTIEPRQGGAVEISFDDGGRVGGVVLRWEPPALLEYEWHFTGEAESVVRFELSADGDGTRLVLDHRLLQADQAPGYGAGWHAHLDALSDLLVGGSGSWNERFAALLPRYKDLV